MPVSHSRVENDKNVQLFDMMFQRWVVPIRLVYLQAYGFDVTETTPFYAVTPPETRGKSRARGQSGEVKPGSTAANQLRRLPLLHSHWTEWPDGTCRSSSPTKPFLSVKSLAYRSNNYKCKIKILVIVVVK